jgi:crotonobetainyl-CoA:carnitine CoA-transferase CaiB-like acyl-CoA transferase
MPSDGPLAGLLVADFSRVLAGPLATMTLGDLGADVIKVERPDGGDDTRAWGPPFTEEGVSTYYLGLNRNKRSVVLDLGDPGDVELARALALRADVVVESFRPGLMVRWGLDHPTLAAENPRLVTCSINAFGSEPPGAGMPGYDLLLQAVSGLMSVTGEPEGRPLKVGAALIDMVCGLYAAIAVLAALQARERSGRGQRVEVSLMDAALSSLINQASGYLGAGVVPGRLGNRHPSIAPYQTLRTGDGEIAVASGNDSIFARLCGALGRTELLADPRFGTNSGRLEHVEELERVLEEGLATADAATWVARLTEAGVPAGPINDVAGAFALAEELGLAPTVEVDGVRLLRPAPRFEDTPASVRRAPPSLDQHGDEIRAWLRSPPPSPGGSSSAA